MRKINATIQGLITGTAMILVSLLIFQLRQSFDNELQYITYAIYVAGIVWTLYYFKKYSSQDKKFKNYFAQGFKCFIVVTLLMVAFTWVFMQLNPGMEKEMAENYRRELTSKGNYTQSEIEANVTKATEYFVPMLISAAIFSYLLIGAMVTAVTGLILGRPKPKQ